jgi:hypothetical protein
MTPSKHEPRNKTIFSIAKKDPANGTNKIIKNMLSFKKHIKIPKQVQHNRTKE